MLKAVYKIKNIKYKKSVKILMCTFLIFPCLAFAANEVMKGFHLKSCSNVACNSLKVFGDTEKGVLAPLYAFAESKYEQIVKIDGKEKKLTYTSKEGYYDIYRSEIVLRGVEELSGGEALINLESGKIQKFLNIQKSLK